MVIRPLKALMNWRASPMDVPAMAADIIDADAWLIEHLAADRNVGDDVVVVDVDEDDHLVATERVEALGPHGGGVSARPGSGER